MKLGWLIKARKVKGGLICFGIASHVCEDQMVGRQGWVLAGG